MSAEAGELFCDRSHTARICAEMPGLIDSYQNVHTALHVACYIMPNDSSVNGLHQFKSKWCSREEDFVAHQVIPPMLFTQDCQLVKEVGQQPGSLHVAQMRLHEQSVIQ